MNNPMNTVTVLSRFTAIAGHFVTDYGCSILVPTADVGHFFREKPHTYLPQYFNAARGFITGAANHFSTEVYQTAVGAVDRVRSRMAHAPLQSARRFDGWSITEEMPNPFRGNDGYFLMGHIPVRAEHYIACIGQTKSGNAVQADGYSWTNLVRDGTVFILHNITGLSNGIATTGNRAAVLLRARCNAPLIRISTELAGSWSIIGDGEPCERNAVGSPVRHVFSGRADIVDIGDLFEEEYDSIAKELPGELVIWRNREIIDRIFVAEEIAPAISAEEFVHEDVQVGKVIRRTRIQKEKPIMIRLRRPK